MVDAPNKNFFEPFRAHSGNDLDVNAFRKLAETLKRHYLDRLEFQKTARIKKHFPWEVQAELDALKRAEEILQRGNATCGDVRRRRILVNGRLRVIKDFGLSDENLRASKQHDRRVLAQRKLAILSLRRERRRLSVLLVKPPRGYQMNYTLDYCVWCLAEEIKEKTGSYRWNTVADLISEYLLETMGANEALKAHRRFAKLRKNRKKFSRVVVSNINNTKWFGRKTPQPRAVR